jgi:hypothetical protein
MAKKQVNTPVEVRIGDHAAILKKLMLSMSSRHSVHTVFEDFCELAAITFSNIVDKHHYAEREERYASTISKYSKQDTDTFNQMLGELILEAERGETPQDIFGPLFHELELHNKYNGQFFTPYNICKMMARMSIGENDNALERRGYVGVCEPCTGSGAMVLAFADAMIANHHNPQTQMWAHCTDVDLKCVHMTYVQLTLYGIPAVVIHGNSLTMQTYSTWYTPAFILGRWPERLEFEQRCEQVIEIMSGLETVQQPSEWEPEPQTVFLPPMVQFNEDARGQLTLF